jgi:hypothetical protein
MRDLHIFRNFKILVLCFCLAISLRNISDKQKSIMVRTGASKSVRHGKHYWRKGTRLDDVEHDLYMRREDERLGFV